MVTRLARQLLEENRLKRHLSSGRLRLLVDECERFIA